MIPSQSRLSGIRLMIQASAAFSFMALCVKLASRSLPSLEVVFFRSLIGTLMILPVMLRKRAPLLGKERGVMALRGISGFLALSLHFYTIAHLPLGTAVLLNYTSPIFSTLLAILLLKEPPRPVPVGAVLVSFAGVFLLAHGRVEHWNLMIFLGLLSAVFASIAYVSIRALRRRESPLTVIFYFTGISTIGSLFFLPFGFARPGIKEWLLLAGVGTGSFYGQLWLTIGLRRAPASLLAPFFYLTPLLSFLYGLIFFGDVISAQSVAGALLIIAGGSAVSYVETKRKIVTLNRPA